jgi:hypothetical protein
MPVVDTRFGKSFYQQFELVESKVTGGYVESRENHFEHLREIVFFNPVEMTGPRSAELVFVGAGEEKDYEGIAVSGKAVLIMGTDWTVFQQTQRAFDKGATACVIVPAADEAGFRSFTARMGLYLRSERMGFRDGPGSRNIIAVSPAAAGTLFRTDEKKLRDLIERNPKSKSNLNERIRPSRLTYYCESEVDVITTENVLGFIPGSEFPDEILIITAHFDHLGEKGGEIYNGADDNGSGTAALLEIAEAFSMALSDGFRPRRSVLFMPLTAEEQGLLGSQYYTEHPVFPLENTIANLNMDMVGRLDPAHEDGNYVCIVGSDWLSSELHAVHERMNRQYVEMELDYTYNAKDHPERFYYRSDQYNFAKHHIPVIFYTSGDHEDYHKPTDTSDKIVYDRVQKVARLVFHTAWELTNRDRRVEADLILYKPSER